MVLERPDLLAQHENHAVTFGETVQSRRQLVPECGGLVRRLGKPCLECRDCPVTFGELFKSHGELFPECGDLVRLRGAGDGGLIYSWLQITHMPLNHRWIRKGISDRKKCKEP